jgi:Mg2+ and Co2+ transporter CorA
VEEEVTALQSTINHQYEILSNLNKVLSPASFHTTTAFRISQHTLESALLGRCWVALDQRSDALKQMQSQIQRLLDDTKTSVEINDDDHGKAILVFTIVTLVFLPLSFVASFLGMNTVDIRNQTTDQSFFWIIALPVTAVVVVLALVIGYKYEGMRDYVESYLGKVKRD